ncbi:Mhf2p NDAI_0A01950 [Naumovozyma dairenensis CBS 421]|uniref:Uncharacterized protein n=1 Tax=Naumovozyma dairenensis (strain ATCC 10597 / BCRC 20456 / CBS 421 / NBRC 0211 / NRRL Y-12639) TaxID=1071378 RepID=G0W3G5_NAUDC|nr:hypothetical protein NDAI_0A01950 [Naumovozyma dairenensis CBS 421]CCD22353.1 hypothetical protein NDAI_0A01950 [Naumovozyma dairenensis CBS 421]
MLHGLGLGLEVSEAILSSFLLETNALRNIQADMTILLETIEKILRSESFQNKDTTITKETILMIQRYMDLFIKEAVIRSYENKVATQVEDFDDEEDADEEDKTIELTHLDLERIVGLLLMEL